MIISFMRNVVIIIRGPLGVGKSTLSRILAERMGAKLYLIDDLLKEAGFDRIDPKLGCIPVANFLAVQEDILPEIKKHLSKYSVVIEGNFYHKDQIDFFFKGLKENPVVVTLKADLETCIARDEKRKPSSGAKTVTSIYNLVSKFDDGLVLDIEGKPRELIVEAIQKWLKKGN
jgi:shikimate kinase